MYWRSTECLLIGFIFCYVRNVEMMMNIMVMVTVTLATPVPALCLQSLRSENENLFKTLKKSFCQFSLLMSVWWIQKHLPHRVLNVKILNKQKRLTAPL